MTDASIGTCEGLPSPRLALVSVTNAHKSKSHVRYLHPRLLPPPRAPPPLSGSFSPSHNKSAGKKQKNPTLHICQGPFFPLLSSSWLAVDSASPRIFAEDSFHIMEKSGCCLLSFPIIPWSSCVSHLLQRAALPNIFFLVAPPYMVKMHPSLFVGLPVLEW